MQVFFQAHGRHSINIYQLFNMLHNTWKLVLGSNCTEEDWQKLMQNKGEQRTG